MTGPLLIVSALSSTACVEGDESERWASSLKAALPHTPPEEDEWFSLFHMSPFPCVFAGRAESPAWASCVLAEPLACSWIV